MTELYYLAYGAFERLMRYLVGMDLSERQYSPSWYVRWAEVDQVVGLWPTAIPSSIWYIVLRGVARILLGCVVYLWGLTWINFFYATPPSFFFQNSFKTFNPTFPEIYNRNVFFSLASRLLITFLWTQQAANRTLFRVRSDSLNITLFIDVIYIEISA